MQLSFRKILDLPLGIGESPVWDHRSEKLWFIDIAGPTIYACRHDGTELVAYAASSSVGSLGLAGETGLVVALRNEVALFEPSTGAWRKLADIEADIASNRTNDGAVGPDGAFWMGTMFEWPPYEPSASFYRIAPDGEVDRIVGGLHVSNGLAWSPDGKRMYHADSIIPQINAYEFDATNGLASAPARWAAFPSEVGHPDGGAVDAEGCYWSAGVSAGRLNRFAPDGKLVEQFELPCLFPTMPCFGGPDLSSLYLTSMSRDDEVGGLFVAEAGVRGLPSYVFGEGGPRQAL